MNEYIFRYNFFSDKTIRYNINIRGGLKVQMPSHAVVTPITIDMVISQTIESCNSKYAIIKVKIEKVTADKNIPADSLPKTGITSTMKMDTLGNLQWEEGNIAWQGAEHSMMRFPEEALQIGSSWIQQLEDAKKEATGLYTKYRVMGTDRRHRHLMNFATEIYSNHPDNPISTSIGKGSFTFNLEDNWIEDCSNFIEYSYRAPVPENPNIQITTTTSLRIEMERIST